MVNELISIFMPTYSRLQSGHLERAIRSVRAQTYPHFELFIVDDASVDGSDQLIQQHVRQDKRIKHIRMPNNVGQPAKTMGIAYQQAQGKYISFVYDDCEVIPTFLTTLLHRLKSEPSLGMAYAQAVLHWADGRQQIIGAPFDPGLMAQGNNHIPNVAVMIRKDVIEHVGWYDPHFLLSRFYDWDLWRRVSNHYPIGFVPEVVAREYGASMSDSIGHTLSYFPHLFLKYAQTDRTQMLLPKQIPNYNPYRLDVFQSWSAKEKQEVYYALMENLVKTYHIEAIINYTKMLRNMKEGAALTQKKIKEKNKRYDSEMHILLEGLANYAEQIHALKNEQISEKQHFIDQQQQFINGQQQFIDSREIYIQQLLQRIRELEVHVQ